MHSKGSDMPRLTPNMQSITAHMFRQVLDGGPIPPEWKHAIRRHTIRKPADEEPVNPMARKNRTLEEVAEIQEQMLKAICAGTANTYQDLAKHCGITETNAKNYLATMRNQGKVRAEHLGRNNWRWVKA